MAIRNIMKYMLNLFDLDGTLIDSHEAICRALNDTLTHFGSEILPYEKSKKFIGLSFAPILQNLGVNAGTEEIMEVYRGYYFNYAEKYQCLFKGIPELLELLKKRVLLSIITNKGRRGTEMTLKSLGIIDYFNHIITEDDVKMLKPSIAPYDKVIDLYRHEGINLDKDDCLMIGDSPVDCEFAANCGIDYAFAKWGFFEPEDLPYKPAYVLNKPMELADINGLNELIEVELTGELDLHAFSPKDISRLVVSYLKKAVENGYHSVRIIHGKGIGVQREIVRKILSKNPAVKTFYDAGQINGGRGATIVEFK